MIKRKKTREISIGNVKIGANNPIAIQSMTNTKTTDVENTLKQIEKLANAGCDIVRVAVPDKSAVKPFGKIKKYSPIPVVADIHFDYKLAIAAIEQGADKIRINPGNIGKKERVKAIVDAANSTNTPIRVGVNSGSLDKTLLKKYKKPTGKALFESAKSYVQLMEELGFTNLVFSIKASDVPTTIEACQLFSKYFDYPQHIGITESGTVKSGTIKSSAGIGALIAMGIGDTMRISLSGDPVEEIIVAKEILKSFNLREGVQVIACPTCGRTNINVEKLANEVEKRVSGIDKTIKIAVMGCVVNGPGEAKEADIGIAGGIKEGLIIKKGKILEKVQENQLLDKLMLYIEDILQSE